MTPKKAIVIGASSGIGRELAKILSQDGYAVGVAARRVDLLRDLRAEIPGDFFIKRIDVSNPEEAIKSFEELIQEIGDLDLLIISSGTGSINPGLEWIKEKETIDVNVSGFVAISTTAMNYFLSRGSGHLVGISSIAALRGSSEALAYNASKAFMSSYLEGLRFRAAKSKKAITVTDIQPGFVDTAMAKGDRLFWVASINKAARQIYTVMKRKRNHAYITKRWRLIAFLFKVMPNWMCEKFL